MTSRTIRRSLLRFLLAVIVAIACMLVLSVQVPSVSAASADSHDFKRFGIGEAFDDEEEDDDWDFMDDDAILELSQLQNGGNRVQIKELTELCVDSVPSERVNDNYCDCDCEDGSDEPNTAACSHVLLRSWKSPIDRKFSCATDDKLVSLAFVGDEVCDCCDGSDEREGACINTCATEWHERLRTLKKKLEMVQRGIDIRKSYLTRSVTKVEQLNADFERLAEAYQTGQRAFEDLKERAQQNPELRGQLEQSYSVLRSVQYVTYVQSRVLDYSTFSDASWKPAFVELVGQCFPFTVNEKQLKGGTPNVIPREYIMRFCPFQNVSQTEPNYPKWAKAERLTKGGGVTVVEEEEVPRPIGLGIWNQWLASDDNLSVFTRVHDYNHGEPCAGGKERQVRVEFSCGDFSHIVAAEERDMCEYEILFSTPAACDVKEEIALLDEIARVEQFPKEFKHQHSKLDVGNVPEGHEEL